VIRARVGVVDKGVLRDEVAMSHLCGLGEAGPVGEECCPRGQLRGLEGYATTGN
jgi:hypothetical protein